MKVRLFIVAVLVAVVGLLSVKAVRVAAQRKEIPLPCPPNCFVLKQDIAWIQHRVAGHDRD